VQSGTHLLHKTIHGRLFAITLSAYNDTSAQPQILPMGAAGGDPGGGEMPMMQHNQLQFMKSPYKL